MTTINSLGKPDYVAPIQSSTSQSTASASDFLSLLDPTAQAATVGSSSTSTQSSASSQQSEADREEAFAKMLVSMQNLGGQVAPTDSASSSDDLAQTSGVSGVGASSSTSSTSSPLQEFKDYMALTPAQKMRYSDLKSVGLTEADLKALPPDQKAKVEAKLADIIKKQTEMQANASTGTSTNSTSGTSTDTGTGTSADSQGQSFLNNALLQMTQSANEMKAKLELGSV